MRSLEEMKEEYDKIPIPDELNIRIQQEIKKSRQQTEEKKKLAHKRRYQKIISRFTAAAAVIGILFITALNTNEVVAKEAAKLPVIGEFARVLTFRSYEIEKEEIAISVEIPTVEMIAEETGIAVDAINQEIFSLCSRYAKEALLRAEEYRNAFLETGGTLEEWAAHEVMITVNYEIKQQSNDYLSFVIRGFDNWANAYTESFYYNLDLKTGKMATLEDLLGEDYEKLVNESVKEQIAERQKNGEIFFDEKEGGFAGITEHTKFYINEENYPVIVFEKYEIAPGSAGELTFEIRTKERQM